jgi:hypothetical protein
MGFSDRPLAVMVVLRPPRFSPRAAITALGQSVKPMIPQAGVAQCINTGTANATKEKKNSLTVTLF